MRLLPALLRRVYRALNPVPAAFVAMRISHPAGGTWHIRDAVLTLQAASTPTPPPTVIALAPPLTLRQLAATLEAAGWTVSDLETTRAGRGAIALIETEEPRSTATLLAHDSLLWALFDAYAVELDAAAAAAAAAPDQMAPQTADGFWLDELGRQYGILRQADEPDVLYAPRLVEEVLRPKSNNLAMAAIIQATTGQPTTVTDVTVYRNPVPAYDGAIIHDGTYTHSATDQAVYGFFDVETTFDLLGATDIATFRATVIALIERLRAAGTMARNINIGGGYIPEPASGPSAEAIADTAAALEDTDAAPPAADTDLAADGAAEITDAAADPADTNATHGAAVADIAEDPAVAADTEQAATGDVADFPEAIAPTGDAEPPIADDSEFATDDTSDEEAPDDGEDAPAPEDTEATQSASLADLAETATGPSAEDIADTTGDLDASETATPPAEDIDESADTPITDAVDAAAEDADIALIHNLTLDGAWTLSGTRALSSGLTPTEPL